MKTSPYIHIYKRGNPDGRRRTPARNVKVFADRRIRLSNSFLDSATLFVRVGSKTMLSVRHLRRASQIPDRFLRANKCRGCFKPTFSAHYPVGTMGNNSTRQPALQTIHYGACLIIATRGMSASLIERVKRGTNTHSLIDVLPETWPDTSCPFTLLQEVSCLDLITPSAPTGVERGLEERPETPQLPRCEATRGREDRTP